jgi:alcohol dehydrogenase class IV
MALITYLTRIQFDFGALALLPQELELLKITRPLLVTDKGVVAAGLLDRVRGALPQGMAAPVFDGTPANPTEAAVRAALEIYRAEGCDGIVAVGGGSALDLAKGVAILATHPGPSLAPYAMIEGGAQRITPAVAPVVAIPTTAGTGSEVGRGAIIVLDDGRKLGIGSPNLIPRLALCDPELTLDLPAAITAGTGMDAIAHCLETYMAPAVNPPAEAIALDGLDKAWRHLERAVRDGHDREARWNMMMAAMEGAMSFQKGLGAVHALSHPLGALKAPVLHHGTLNAVFLPAVIRFNAPVLGPKLECLAAIMGTAASGAAIADAVARLTARVGLPTSLKAMGAPQDILPAIADAALKDHCHATNPRRATREDYLAILGEAYAA